MASSRIMLSGECQAAAATHEPVCRTVSRINSKYCMTSRSSDEGGPRLGASPAATSTENDTSNGNFVTKIPRVKIRTQKINVYLFLSSDVAAAADAARRLRGFPSEGRANQRRAWGLVDTAGQRHRPSARANSN